LNKLRLLKIGVRLIFTKNTHLHPFIGNTIRGAFGQSLYDNFPNLYDCVFKTELIKSTPNPFVISAPYPSNGIYKTDDTLDFAITLFGNACDYESDVLSAVKKMCNGKLSNSEVTEIKQIYSREWSDEGAKTIPYTDTLTLRFCTPTEILFNKKSVVELDFHKYIDSLFVRIAGVIDNHTDNEFIVPYNLVAIKPSVKAEYTLDFVKLQATQPISGFIGTIRYFGDVTRYLPYIDLGSQIHIGKKATFSCGEYSFEI